MIPDWPTAIVIVALLIFVMSPIERGSYKQRPPRLREAGVRRRGQTAPRRAENPVGNAPASLSSEGSAAGLSRTAESCPRASDPLPGTTAGGTGTAPPIRRLT